MYFDMYVIIVTIIFSRYTFLFSNYICNRIDMNKKNPENLLYTRDHEWISREKVNNEYFLVGITDYAQEQLGDIVYLEVPETDKKFLKGDVLAEIENVKSVNNIMAPANGHIREVNDQVLETPEIIKNDPFGKGWILKYDVADPNDLGDLMDHQQYTLFLGTLEDK